MESLPFNQLLDLSDKVAIVTGGAMGIGFGIVDRLAQAKAAVMIADFNEDHARFAAEKLTSQNLKVSFVKVDVSKQGDIKNMVDQTIKEFGGVDILVNNAGIYPQQLVADMSLEDFDKVLSVNLKGVFLGTKYVSEVMIKQGRGGKIINISSIDALHPSSVGLAHYDASKHGVWGFTKNAALEFAPYKIQINAIAPGAINTPGVSNGQKGAAGVDMSKILEAFMAKIPMHRIGEPDDIGKVALFLASDMSSYMTGSQIVVDGGALLS